MGERRSVFAAGRHSPNQFHCHRNQFHKDFSLPRGCPRRREPLQSHLRCLFGNIVGNNTRLPDGYEYIDAYASSASDSNTHPHPHGHPNGDADTQANTCPETDADPPAEANAYADAYPYPHAYGHTRVAGSSSPVQPEPDSTRPFWVLVAAQRYPIAVPERVVPSGT